MTIDLLDSTIRISLDRKTDQADLLSWSIDSEATIIMETPAIEPRLLGELAVVVIKAVSDSLDHCFRGHIIY